MLDDDAVLEHGDLGVAGALVRRLGADLVAHDHHPLDGLAAGQEFGLAQDRRTATAGVTAVPAALPLGLQPGRAADALDLVVVLVAPSRPRLALVHDGVGRIVGRAAVAVVVARAGLAAAAATATARCALGAARLVVAVVIVGVVAVVIVGRRSESSARRRRRHRRSRRRPARRDHGRDHGGHGGGAWPRAGRPGRRRNRPVVVVVVVVLVVVVVAVVGVGFESDRLRRHEQRQVVGGLGFGGGLEDQPRLGLVRGDVGARLRRRRPWFVGHVLGRTIGRGNPQRSPAGPPRAESLLIGLGLGHRRPRILLKPPGASCLTRPREGFRYGPGLLLPGLLWSRPERSRIGTVSVPV